MLKTGVTEHAKYKETKNLGELFKEAIKGQSTNRQKNPIRNPDKSYKRGYRESGIRRVNKVKSSTYKQGYYFRYTHKRGKGQKTIQSKSVKALYDKMQDKGYEFIIDDIKRARSFLDQNCNSEDYKFFMNNVLHQGIN